MKWVFNAPSSIYNPICI